MTCMLSRHRETTTQGWFSGDLPSDSCARHDFGVSLELHVMTVSLWKTKRCKKGNNLAMCIDFKKVYQHMGQRLHELAPDSLDRLPLNSRALQSHPSLLQAEIIIVRAWSFNGTRRYVETD